jgi:NAD(P)-dependent dehydrogenase (short-subunit alcohol dehydrogenase family)
MTSSSDRSPAALFDLTGRTAIVTGGSRGIGQAIAGAFAEAGARVVVASRKADACEEAASDIRSRGGEALAVAAHVGRAEDIEDLVARAAEWGGGIDIVVNNAANPLGGPLMDVTEKAFTKSFEVNVLGPLRVCQAAMPHLEASGHASVINVMTVGAFRGAAYLGLYTSSKAALWNLTRTMAKEWGPQGIRVNAIAPGPFETEMMSPTLSIPEFRQQIVDSTIQRRIADVPEIVGAALLLASDAGSYMTGSCVVVDGGTSA